MRAIFSAAAAVLATSLFAHAPGLAASDPLEDARAASLAGDFAQALSILHPLAEDGNAEAQAMLGFLYESGGGVSVDMVQAVHWYRLAAEKGNAAGQTNLCAAYINGYAGRRDATEGLRWCMLAAEQGSHVAQYNLAVGYLSGEGVPKDIVQSYVRVRLADWYAQDDRSKALYNQLLEYLWGIMSGPQIVEGDGLVDAWKKAHP